MNVWRFKNLGCVLALTLFRKFFSLPLVFAFGSSPESVYLQTRADGKLFEENATGGRCSTSIPHRIRPPKADGSALTACNEFALTISIQKTNIMGQDVGIPPHTSVNNKTLDCVNTLTYLMSTVSSNLSLGMELSTRLTRAAAMTARLSKRVWYHKNLTVLTKLQVFQTCIISTLLHGSETWTPYTRQDKHLNNSHL